jgi:predicted RNA-binding Zn-ribbon protein involved in translation (DUF1610 family)
VTITFHHHCPVCNDLRAFVWIRDKIARGRRFEVYECPDCGNELHFAVT